MQDSPARARRTSRNSLVWLAAGAAVTLLLLACSGEGEQGASTGGSSAVAGQTSNLSGSSGSIASAGIASGSSAGNTGGSTGGVASGASGGAAAGASTGGSAGTGVVNGGAGAGGGAAGSGGAQAGGGANTAGSGGAGGGGSGAGGSSGGGGTSGVCSKPAAPSDMRSTIDLTWKEMTGGFAGKTGARPVSSGVQNFKNAVLDQVMESGGSLNFCVRYESNVMVSAAQRDQVAVALQRGVDEWFAKIQGHDCFPHSKVTTKITGWATVNRSTFDWPDGGVPLYINQIGYENVAQCPDACSRFVRYHAGQATKGYAYPGCNGGAANRFDMHLWLTEGMGFGGAGGDWGQRLDRQYFMDSLNSAHQHIWLHEFGHGFGFPDYYEWETWAPGVAVPNSVMVAGLAQQVTDWDQWMLRHTWSQLKSRWP